MSGLPVLINAGPDDPRAWVRVARAVLADIHAGKLQPGDCLPSSPGVPEPGPAAARELLTVGECAAQARVAVMTIYRMLDAGTVESVRIGRSRRIYADSWAAYLNSATTRPGQP